MCSFIEIEFMPNKGQHMSEGGATGAVVAFLGNVIVQAERKRSNPAYQFNAGEAVAVTIVGYGVGSLAGTLPDVLEPAYHPGHRDFCHSWAAGALLVAGAKKLNDNPAVPLPVKTLANSGTAAYLMHLYADSKTPAGIPLVTRK
jgi:inner membrane protein